jgi:predicted nucleic acid-binding protein
VPQFLADTSAWHRSGRVADRWEALVESGELVLCAPVRLELLYSAPSRTAYAELAWFLAALPSLSIDRRVEVSAEQTQRELAKRSQHRGPTAVDQLVAAAAEVHGATLLHYDRHFDAIARITGQPSEWIARRGALD